MHATTIYEISCVEISCVIALRVGEPQSPPDGQAPYYLSKTDLVTATLRAKIVRGELPPGSQVRQRELAEEFKVSPTPIREAMRRLEAEGLLSYDAHIGVSVVEVDFGPTVENFRIRAALESLCASLAAEKATDLDLADIEKAMHALHAGSDSEYARLNREFHLRIYTTARSPLLFSMIRRLWDAFGVGPTLARNHKQSREQHEKLLAALASHDAEKAEVIAREHVLTGIKRTGTLRR